MLDRIDYNMEMVVERVKEGNKELTIVSGPFLVEASFAL